MQKIRSVVAIFFVLSVVCFAKDVPKQVLNWPNDAKPLLRFTVSKIREVSSFKGQNTYILDTTVENLSGKPVSKAEFSLYFFDKKNVRIGDGHLGITNVRDGETIRISVDAFTAGAPASIGVNALEVPQEWSALAPVHKVSVTVYSVPAGATVKVDGKDAGTTPVALMVSSGGHQLEFSKQGYNQGTFPLVVTPDQLSGGSVTYELGASAHDSVELRDGTVLTADVESVSAQSVIVRIGGAIQTFDRNQVKRIGFTVRQ